MKDRTYLSWKVAALLIAPAVVLLFVKTDWAWALALAWALGVVLLVRYDLARTVRPSALEVERTMPPKLSMGVPNPVIVRVHNPTGLVARATVRETPPPGFFGERMLPPLEIGPAASVELRLEYAPPGRGLFSFGAMGARCMGPLGLAGRRGECGASEEVRVYPDITAVHKYALLSRKGALFELGLRPMRFAGQGTEFESLREYRSGDAYRDVDWKATARKAGPVVRTFEAERSQTVVLAVDAGRLMTPVADGMAKLDRAVNAALLLAYLAIEADDQVGLLVFGREVETYLPPGKGHTQFLAILEALYAVEGRVEEPDYRRAFGYLARRLSKRSLIVVFTDLAGVEPSKRLLDVLLGLVPRHLPLVVTQRDRRLERLTTRAPAAELDVYEGAVAEGTLHEKASALRVLTARGALALDVYPEDLSVSAVNRYLEVKSRGEL